MTAAKRRSSSGTANSAAAAATSQTETLAAAATATAAATSGILRLQHHQHQHYQQQQQQVHHEQNYQYSPVSGSSNGSSTQQHHRSNHQNYHENASNQYQQRHHYRHLQQEEQQQPPNQQQYQKLRDCSVKLPLDILWLPKSAMRPIGPESSHTDCILVVGVSRPKLAVVFLTVMLVSLFLTFHVLYDSAVYNIQAAQQSATARQRLVILSAAAAAGNRLPEFNKPAGGSSTLDDSASSASSSRIFSFNGGSVVPSSNQISHPMVFPSNRVHFPKTSRRLPQALIIGIRKCGTRALLEMLYLHPRIQKAGGEVHFFDRDENYLKGLEWYRKKMPHSFRGQITIEKSPSYFVSPEVPERVRAMNASIRLLLIVREPVTRAISDYTQLRSHAATATLPLAADSTISESESSAIERGVTSFKQQQQQQPAPTSYVGSRTTLTGQKITSSSTAQQKSHNSVLYGKLSAYSAAAGSVSHVYDGGGEAYNGIVRGGSIKHGGLISANTNRHYDGAAVSGNGGTEHYSILPTAPSAASSPSSAAAAAAAAQIASKTFEELAIFPNGTVNDSYRPLSISMYHLHLHPWLEVFPREQILVVNGDRLIDDPVSQLRRIETFLGIEHRVTSKHFYFNETKGFYCLRYDSGDRCLRETKGRRHPHVDPIVVSKLRKFFAEHNQRFYELVGEDLGWPEE